MNFEIYILIEVLTKYFEKFASIIVRTISSFQMSMCDTINSVSDVNMRHCKRCSRCQCTVMYAVSQMSICVTVSTVPNVNVRHCRPFPDVNLRQCKLFLIYYSLIKFLNFFLKLYVLRLLSSKSTPKINSFCIDNTVTS